MRNALPMIVVVVLLALGLGGLLWMNGNDGQKRLDKSPIGIDGLVSWLGAEGIAVQRANARSSPTLERLSFAIRPLYDDDLLSERPEPATPREAYYSGTLREADQWLVHAQVQSLPSLVVLPKWVAGTVTSTVAHESALIPQGAVQRLPTQLGTWNLGLIRPAHGFVTASTPDGDVALFEPQLFDPEAMPEECLAVLPLPQGVLIAQCLLANGGEDYETNIPVYLLSDPDLINNHGLAVADNAAVITAFLRRMSPASATASADAARIYVEVGGEDYIDYYNYSDEGEDYDRTGEDFARFFTPPLAGLWAVLSILLGLAFWRGARRFGPARGDADDTPEQSKRTAIATNARLLRIAGHDGRLAADMVNANLSDLAQATFGRAAGAGPQGIQRLFAHLTRRDPAAAAELQAVSLRLINTAQPLSPTALSRELDTFRRLLETLTHGK